jgi:hypothetical protein
MRRDIISRIPPYKAFSADILRRDSLVNDFKAALVKPVGFLYLAILVNGGRQPVSITPEQVMGVTGDNPFEPHDFIAGKFS